MITIYDAYEGHLFAVQEPGARTVWADFSDIEDAREYMRVEGIEGRILKVTVEEVK